MHGTATVAVTVTNTGGATSREVVQVYLEPRATDQPVRLVGWAAVDVAAGESATVTVTGDRAAVAPLGHRGRGGSTLAGGELLVARGLGDVRDRLPDAP